MMGSLETKTFDLATAFNIIEEKIKKTNDDIDLIKNIIDELKLEQGPQGSPGTNGLQGPRGEKGERGPAGPTGHTGAPGPRGIDGVNGKDGVKGDQGSPGVMGPPGPAGKDGKDGKDFDPETFQYFEGEISYLKEQMSDTRIHLENHFREHKAKKWWKFWK